MAAAVATSEPMSGLGLALVKQELECGVCLDLYERPVTLACGHSLCEGCAKHMVGMEKSGSAFIRCPHCRAKTRWKSGKANLKVNITLQNMVDRVKKAQKADEEKRKEQEAKLKKEREQEAKREAKAKAKAKAKESSSTEQAAIPEVVPSPALDSALTKILDAAGSASPPPAASSTPPPPREDASNVGKALAKGKEKKQTLSAEPFAAIPLEEDDANVGSFTNPDAVAAFDAAIAALVSQQDARGRGQDQSEQLPAEASSSPFSPASPLGVALHGGAQELSLPSPSLYTQADQHVLSTSPDRPPAAQHHLLLDLADEATTASSSLPLPFAEESFERKRERKERRRERSSRSGRDSTGEWDDGRDRLSRSCRSPVNSPTSRGRSEYRSRSQDTDRRSRSQTRGSSEKSVTIVYDGIPQEYFQMLMAQGGPLQQVEQATNCKIEATTQQGKTRGIAISGHPDDVRQARKQLVALIREEALQQDRWASGSSGETNRAASSTLVKKKMNISRRQYEMLLSNDLQLLHSIEATTDTSVIFPTNINARAASVPITISGKREGVNITVDFLKANEEATGTSGSSGVSGHPARSQSATVPVAPRPNTGAQRSSLSSTRSATHSRRRRRKIPATEGRVPNCLIS